jgi:hypothetical protein
MKDKLIIITVISILIVLGICGGYFVGLDGGKKLGYVDGYDKGKYDSYEKSYSLGYDNGKEFVVTHLDQYITVPKAVGYSEVVTFLRTDQTDKNEYVEQVFDCVTFTKLVKEDANGEGIKCAFVIMDLSGAKKNTSHAINAFETTDRGIVYFDPQTDGERFGIYVGGTYKLSEVYKITKVDIIW